MKIYGTKSEERMNMAVNEIDALASKGIHEVVALVDCVLAFAAEVGATDIHFDPTEAGTQLAVRLQGRIRRLTLLPKEISVNVANRCKVIAGLLVHRSDRPQEGNVNQSELGLPVALRMSVYPTRWGECISIRLLEIGGVPYSLEKLGLPAPVREHLTDNLMLHDGMIVLAGPAGSGKTTTLYAALQTISEKSCGERRIVSIENPVESNVPGVMQTEVLNNDEQSGFAASLAAILRHDIEVIMVGEIRDDHTAQVAVEGALSGHLLLATIHASRAHTVPYRMLEMDVPPYALAGSLRFVVSQRLLRLKRAVDNANQNSPASGIDQDYSLLAETLTCREELRSLIMRKGTLQDFANCTQKEGPTLLLQAKALLDAGVVEEKEVLRVLAMEWREGKN